MRPAIVALCLLAVLGTATAADASCHFCLEQTVASCTGLQADSCKENASYTAEHLPDHLLHPECLTAHDHDSC